MHRLACRAVKAQDELTSLLRSCNVQDAHRDMGLANDEIEKLTTTPVVTKKEKKKEPSPRIDNDMIHSQEQEERDRNQRRWKPSIKASTTEQPARDNNKTTASSNNISLTSSSTKTKVKESYSKSKETVITSVVVPKRRCRFVVQNLSGISCYSLTLELFEPPTTNDSSLMIKLEHIPSSLEENDYHETTTILVLSCLWHDDDEPIRIALAGHVTEAVCQQVSNRQVVSIRLSYVADSAATWLETATLTPRTLPTVAETMACGYCHFPLIRHSHPSSGSTTDNNNNNPSTIIQRVLPLPSNRWDDMMDYLTCYPGQTAVTFNAAMTEGQPGRLLEDETTILAHANDISTCALHTVSNYGSQADDDTTTDTSDHTNTVLATLDADASFRGARLWRDTVVGTTITCPCCASILGTSTVVPDETTTTTIRLLKHRLVVKDDQDTLLRPFVSISAFIAWEMIRYAENKAIFAFRVQQQQQQQSKSHKSKHCLVLRIINWDNLAASSEQCTQSTFDGDTVYHLKWKRMVQLVFEVANDSEATSTDDTDNNKNPMWMWSNTNDWCCEIDQQDEKKTATNLPASVVHIVLEKEEWNRLHAELQHGSSFLSEEVRAATVLAKTGSTTADLAAIFLN